MYGTLLENIVELKLLKLTRSGIQPDLLFADFEIVEKEILLVGCRFNQKNKRLFLPTDKGGNGQPYATAKFTRQNDFAEFILKGTTLILNSKLPILEETLGEKTKQWLAKRRSFPYKKRVPDGRTGPQKDQGSNQVCRASRPAPVWNGRPHQRVVQGGVPSKGREGLSQLDTPKAGD